MGRCPRLTGAEGSYPAVDFRPMQRLEYHIDHGIELRLDVAVPEAQYTVSGRPQETVAPIVIFGPFEMLTSIQFDDESPVKRGEIADVEANLVLAAEFETGDLAATKAAPEKTLGSSLVVSERACMAKHVRIEHCNVETICLILLLARVWTLDPSAPVRRGHLPI